MQFPLKTQGVSESLSRMPFSWFWAHVGAERFNFKESLAPGQGSEWAQMGPNSGTKRVFFSFGTVWRIVFGVLHGLVPHFVPFSLTPVASAMSLGAIWLAQGAILMSLFVHLT